MLVIADRRCGCSWSTPPTGRRLYATGFNPNAARLANIRVNRLRFCSLLTSAGLAGFAGVMLASSLAAGSPSAGTSYLLPAFATVFVGATVFKQGRFNAWGTIVGVLMLGTGMVGLGLVSAPLWAIDMFTGVVLIAALGASVYQSRSPLRNQTGRARWLPARMRRASGPRLTQAAPRPVPPLSRSSAPCSPPPALPPEPPLGKVFAQSWDSA